jgi:type II secretory pathway pseudopilin PulG
VLLEALVALAIIGLVALSLLQARGQQIRVAGQARELLVAQALAEDRLGSMRILDYAGLADPADSLLAGSFPEPFDAFSWTAEIAPMEDELDLFHVAVAVSGPAERFPLATLIHRPRPTLTTAGGNGGGGRR